MTGTQPIIQYGAGSDSTSRHPDAPLVDTRVPRETQPVTRDPAHEALVEGLLRDGAIRSDRVREAMLAVDRKRFVPAGEEAQAYEDAAVTLKLGSDGLPASTISQPSMVALMLEELAPAVGDKVLEVGTASGYNAALLAHLVGPTGAVFTVEVDDGLACEARDRFGKSSHVAVLAGDGRDGFPEAAPYAGIIVTAGAAAIAPAWVNQLDFGGRLVVPLTGDDRSGRCVTYEKTEDGLVECHAMPCGFVPLRGPD